MGYDQVHHHLGVYAIILNASKSHILLIEKARGPYTGLLDLPGGSMEPLETLEQTLAREVLEETGTKIIEQAQLQAVSVLYPYQKGEISCCLRHVGILYRAEIKGNVRATGDRQDARQAIWQPIKAIKAGLTTPMVQIALGLIP